MSKDMWVQFFVWLKKAKTSEKLGSENVPMALFNLQIIQWLNNWLQIWDLRICQWFCIVWLTCLKIPVLELFDPFGDPSCGAINVILVVESLTSLVILSLEHWHILKSKYYKLSGRFSFFKGKIKLNFEKHLAILVSGDIQGSVRDVKDPNDNANRINLEAHWHIAHIHLFKKSPGTCTKISRM